jgi:hypothetical protein
MVDPISVISGIIAADVARKLACHLDDTDEEIRKHLKDDNVEEAIKASDKTTLDNMYSALSNIRKNEDVNITDEDLKTFKQATNKRVEKA